MKGSIALATHDRCVVLISVRYWLADHPELQAIRHEVYDLVKSQPGRLVTRLHQLTQNLPRGYKSPTDINQEHVVDYYRRYFPKTKLFVGIRHPVLVRTSGGRTLPGRLES
jgi:hypothetical protein